MDMVKVLKNNAVLIAAWALAALSMLAVHPGKEYFEYIDWKTLGILWSLMVIMQFFQYQGIFRMIGGRLLDRTSNAGQLSAVLILLCFFMGMIITNDVALLTFVPFSIMLLCECGRKDLLIPVIVLQTIAANLGSMMLQIGNPQNLFLFGISTLDTADFIKLMLPYSLLSLVLLAACVFFLKNRKQAIAFDPASMDTEISGRKWVIIYLVLFIIAIASVMRIVPWYVTALLVFAATLLINRCILLRADYSLLMTFVGFFIFTGNISRMPAVSDLLISVIRGHEIAVSVIVSQFISNVPAALLLSDFTDNISGLIVGTNLGGLGTLIASMASLISFRLYADSPDAEDGKYLLVFSILNIAFLAALLILNAIIL